MITHCFSDPVWIISDAEPVFVDGTVTLLKVIIPAGIGLAQLKLYAAKRRLCRPRTSTLALEVQLHRRETNDYSEDQLDR
jgi:hypothetical protein